MSAAGRIGVFGHAGGAAGRLLLGRAPYVYAGFVGAGNLGDEAMFEAIRDHLALGGPVIARTGTPTLPLRVAERWGRPSRARLLLGGGTLIGRRGWIERVELALRATHGHSAISVGTGVEDPSFQTANPLTDSEELRRWVPVLRNGFHRVTVRGPRSAEILGSLGIEAEVIGDPALLNPTTHKQEEFTEGDVVINIGASGPTWGSQQDLLSHLAEYGKELVRRGLRLRLVVMWHRDLEIAHELTDRLGDTAVTIVTPQSPAELRRELAGAHVVIGQRLHSVVIATAALTPCIALAYRPKCEDFQMSIGRMEFTMRTDQIDVATLLDLTQDAVDNRPAHVDALRQEVAGLQGSLIRTLDETRTLLVSGSIGSTP